MKNRKTRKHRILTASVSRYAMAAFLVVLSGAGARPASAAVEEKASSGEDNSTRRVALIIGSHEGGKDRERLVYSGADAFAFRRTLEELGGLKAGDATLLIDPDSARILQALDDMQERTRALKRTGARVEAVVYYSGHADENGLRLGAEGMDYRTFRARLNNLGADVRIAVVDACESGALTRMKGGRSAPAFLVDQSTRSEGYAILTSSSENESAQESDRVGGSYFTHALNTGLRGAADASRDGKVTLHEAYQFAYNETLERTQATRGGPQHAGYDIQLTGSGDVVLTDLRQASAFMDLSKDLQGRLFIRDSSENLAAELQKPAGSEMRIGLSPGVYGLRLLQDGRWSTASVILEDGKPARVVPSLFQATGAAQEENAKAPENENDSIFHYVPRTAPGGLSTGLLYDWVKTEYRGVQLAPIGTGARSHLRGGQLSLGLNSAGGDVEGFQVAIGTNITLGSLHGTQFSNGANIVARDLRGAQFTTGVNVAGGSVTGFQGAVGLNTSGDSVEGWQVSVGGNLAGGGVKGAQAAVGFNLTADSLNGGQASVGFNVAGDEVKGGQGAVGFNVAAGKVRGGQGAVGFNYAGSLQGFQAAVGVNIAGKVRGTQIGLLNLSDEYVSGAPLGLLNISRKGSFEAESWVEENGMTFLGLRTGVNWMHSHLAVGTKPLRDGPRLLAPTLGMSVHFPVGAPLLYGEAGLFHTMVFEPEHPMVDDDFNADLWSRAHLGLGFKPLSFLTVFGGLSYNVANHEHSDAPFSGNDSPFFRTYGDVSLWPGAFIGLRIGK